MNLAKDLKVTRAVGDVVLTAEVSPCSWMYAGYGLQIKVTLPRGDFTIIHRKDIPIERATESDVRSLLETARIVPCKKCGKPAFDPSNSVPHQSGECQACELSKLRAELDEEQKAEAHRREKRDAEFKGKGFTHRVDAWIHPQAGDDYGVSFYTKNATEAEIRAHLKKEGSLDPTDYVVCQL